MTKTILQVLPALNSGGVERGTVDIAKAIADNGWNSIVASSGGKMTEMLAQAGIQHIHLPLNTKNPASILLNANRLIKIIKKHNVSLVHARSRSPAWSAYMATQKTELPFITTFHGVYSFSSNLKKKYNSVMTRGQTVIAVSEFIRSHIIQNYKTQNNIEVIHRGVDTKVFDPSQISQDRVNSIKNSWGVTEGKPVIFMPGRITRWKGQHILIAALAKLIEKDFYCIIAGYTGKHNSYRKELEGLIKRSGLSDNVKIVPAVADMPAGYMASDFVICPSTRPEAFGRIPIEAQAMKKPIIATNHGGAKETVIKTKTGLLVPPKDINSLSEAVKNALNYEWFSPEAARENVENKFSLAKMCEKTISIYERNL